MQFALAPNLLGELVGEQPQQETAIGKMVEISSGSFDSNPMY